MLDNLTGDETMNTAATETNFYAIEPFSSTVTKKTSYTPEEVGSDYQDLCQYIMRNVKATGGFSLKPDGSIETFSREKLEKDYDPESDPSYSANEYDYEREADDRQRSRERLSETA